MGLATTRHATVYLAVIATTSADRVINAGTQYGTTFTYCLGNPNAVAANITTGLGYCIDPAFAAGLNSQNGIIGQR